jgi:hypothetical protein
MPSIEIDCALTNSEVSTNGFTAAGTWDGQGNPSQITCTLSGSANVTIPVTARSDGTWSGDSGRLAEGTYSLTASFLSAAADTETNIQVRGNNGARVSVGSIDTGVPVMGDGGDTGDAGDAVTALAAAPAKVKFTVSGTYVKGNVALGGKCMAVTRNGRQVGTVLASEPIPMPNAAGDWTVTLTLNANDAPGRGQKLTVVAELADANGTVVARFGRKGPKKP